MHTAIGLDNIRHLAHLERVRSFLKWLLHHAALEPTKVTAIAVRRAVRILGREFAKLFGIAIDLYLVLAQELDRLLL